MQVQIGDNICLSVCLAYVAWPGTIKEAASPSQRQRGLEPRPLPAKSYSLNYSSRHQDKGSGTTFIPEVHKVHKVQSSFLGPKASNRGLRY